MFGLTVAFLVEQERNTVVQQRGRGRASRHSRE